MDVIRERSLNLFKGFEASKHAYAYQGQYRKKVIQSCFFDNFDPSKDF